MDDALNFSGITILHSAILRRKWIQGKCLSGKRGERETGGHFVPGGLLKKVAGAGSVLEGRGDATSARPGHRLPPCFTFARSRGLALSVSAPRGEKSGLVSLS